MEQTRKHSKKREAIYNALRATKEHPSAEMLHNTLKSLYPDLSLGTVYRNLALFVGDGSAICVGTVAGQERYDADTRPHAHFVCERCGRVLDVRAPELMDGLYSMVEESTGGEVRSHSLSFSGLCADCK